jgi:hypothetical protein
VWVFCRVMKYDCMVSSCENVKGVGGGGGGGGGGGCFASHTL